MQRAAAEFSPELVEQATSASRSRLQKALDAVHAPVQHERFAVYERRSRLKLAQSLQDDPQRQRRVLASMCRPCFYIVRLAGAAITHQPCMLCDQNQTYPSTATDVLCLPCATARHLCKRCGADLCALQEAAR